MKRLSNLREIEISDILPELPDIEQLDMQSEDTNRKDDLFLVALGFEDRCSWAADILADSGKYKALQGIYFEYATNQSDNDLNRQSLVSSMETICSTVASMYCDTEHYPQQLRAILNQTSKRSENPSVTFDISVCSSKLLVTTFTVLLEYNIDLRIIYSEADTYHPTEREYKNDPDRWTKDDALGLTRGVSEVKASPEHPGRRQGVLPEAVIVFPTFKPERARAIITYIDPSLLMHPGDRVVWLIGDPHLQSDHWRAEVIREINQIPASALAREVSTFDYKMTIKTMERVYENMDCKYHVTIAPLGSKLQCIGIVLFWYMRPETSIVFASPHEYNADQYSEGCKAVWHIDFGILKLLRRNLDKVGHLQTVNEIK